MQPGASTSAASASSLRKPSSRRSRGHRCNVVEFSRARWATPRCCCGSMSSLLCFWHGFVGDGSACLDKQKHVLRWRMFPCRVGLGRMDLQMFSDFPCRCPEPRVTARYLASLLVRRCVRGDSVGAYQVARCASVRNVAQDVARQEAATKWEADKEALAKEEEALGQRWVRLPRAVTQGNIIACPC